MLKLAQTRWLSRSAVIARIIEQWEPLLLYFQSSSTTEKDRNECDKVTNIYKTITNPGTFHMLLFLNGVLPKIDKMNKEFQSHSSRIHLVFKTIRDMYRVLLGMFMRDEFVLKEDLPDPLDNKKYKSLNSVILGGRCLNELVRVPLRENSESKFREDCRNFLVELCRQMQNRFDFSHTSVLAKMECLNPAIVLDAGKRPASLIPVAGKFPNLVPRDALDDLDDQWREILFARDQLANIDDSTPEKFWGAVLKLEDGNGNQKFGLLGGFMANLLAFPHSTAAVERIFSEVNQVKTPRTNRLHASTVQNRLLANQHISRQHQNCATWIPHQSILKDIESGACHSRYCKGKPADGGITLVYDIDGVETEDL
jgi:hypothetical protein